MQPDPRRLLDIAGIDTPLVGYYDAPDPTPFRPLVEPEPDTRACVFSFYERWRAGETLHLTPARYGCGGAGRYLCGVTTGTPEDMVKFLVDEEGLKASHELMREWLGKRAARRREHEHALLGPLRADQYPYLRTVTFWVTPDQLGLLSIGAQYRSRPGDPPPVLAPFGAGCMQMTGLFPDPGAPQAIISATDIAMRKHVPADILAFTVTKPTSWPSP